MKIPDSKLFYGTAALLTAAQLVSAQTPPSLGLQMVAIEFSSLAQLTLPAGLTGLTELDLGANVLTSLALPADATNLAGLSLFFNQLTDLTLPPGLTRLTALLSPQKFYRARSAP